MDAACVAGVPGWTASSKRDLRSSFLKGNADKQSGEESCWSGLGVMVGGCDSSINLADSLASVEG